MSKQAAKDLVNAFSTQSGGGVWPNVNRARLAAGLIVRIDDPNKIDQQGTPLCGPASLTRSIAMDNPLAYAQAAVNLFNTGQAQIGAFNIRPGSELKNSAVLGNADPADWIMLASIRDSENWVLSTAGWFGLNLAGITTPGTLEEWLKTTGYREVINVTYILAKPIPSVRAVDAACASKYYNDGYKVFLFIDSDMLDVDCQDDLFSLYPDHWVMLDSVIEDSGLVSYTLPVKFSAYSWGQQLAVPVDANKPLTKRHFLNKFYGYIAARL